MCEATTLVLAGQLGFRMTLSSRLSAAPGRLTNVTVVRVILCRPRGGTLAVTLMVTLAALPSKTPGR